MKFLILGIIQLYWLLIPEKRRRNCIFKISCSHFVFTQAKENGFVSGLNALNQRFKKCRPGYKTIRQGNQIIGLQLSDGTFIKKDEISIRLIENERNEL